MMRISLYSVQRLLLYCFIFFGPLGTLLTPSFLPKPFRFYYLFLPFFPIFFLRMRAAHWKVLLTFIPFLFYILISAYFTENKQVGSDAHPLFRAGLLISQYLFILGAAFTLRSEEKKPILILYLTGFLLSLLVGYLLYIGYYIGAISFESISRLSVEAQIGSGILRFSPGSYPNEYGIVASFVLTILILILAERKKFSLSLYTFSVLTFIALLLTSTRAAYYSFIISSIYLCFISQGIRRFSIKLLCIGAIAIMILKYYSFDIIQLTIEGIKSISFTSGTTGIRVTEWIKGFNELGNSPFFGTGFGANISTHNVYLELLYELGVVGILLLLVSLVYYLSQNHFSIFKSRSRFSQITIIGLIQLSLFALTNHNMNHHLTWLTFLFFNLHLTPLPEKSLASLSRPAQEAP
ncbi:MAG: hypothetical protein K1060chlam2_00372 [Chlamydiae bacterium]|nr:hypothetical protein [Chlamydiota bacterium]